MAHISPGPIKLRIVSDGRSMNTTITDVASGRRLQDVQSISWSCKVGEQARVQIEIMAGEVELDVNLTAEELASGFREIQKHLS